MHMMLHGPQQACRSTFLPLPAIVLPVVLMALLLCGGGGCGRDAFDADIQTDVEFLFHEREPFALVVQEVQPKLGVHAVDVLGLPRRRSPTHGAVQHAERLHGLPLHDAALPRPLAVGTGLHADGNRRGARPLAYDLEQAEKRAHILEGLLIAVDNIDEVIRIIRSAKPTDEAKAGLIERFSLTEVQASAIIDMRLRVLTGLERDKLKAEYDDLCKQIEYFKEVLDSYALQMKIVKDELIELRDKYGDERRTELVMRAEEFNPEDFYADDEMVITISHMGYIKRTPLTEYRTQNRGGVGMKGSATRDEDFIEHIYVTTMHNTMLFFTEKGRCYWLKVYAIPEGSRSSKGRALQNVIQIEPDDKIRAYINVRRLNDKEYVDNNYIIMCTKEGVVKKTRLEAYSRPRQNGVNAITIREGDQLIEAKLTTGNSEVLIAAKEGKAIRFNEEAVRPIGRTGAGVKGITIEDDDEVIGMVCVEPDSKEDILVVSENGYGKRTDLEDYRITNRGGKGVKTLLITEKTGKLIAIKSVTDDNDLMIINRSGLTIRIPVSDIRVSGRATQGVKVINLREGDSIASVIPVPKSDDEEQPVVEQSGVEAEATDVETTASAETMNSSPALEE